MEMRAMSQDGRSARAKNIYDEAHKNLVDSAIELFNNPDIPNGKINLSLIAKEAGTSVATAYNHFPENLIDVFGSIFNIAFEKIVDAVTEFNNANPDPHDQLKAYLLRVHLRIHDHLQLHLYLSLRILSNLILPQH